MSTVIGTDGNYLFYNDDAGGLQKSLVGIKTVRAPHVVTQAEIDQAWAVIPVKWPVPFMDSNYTVIWSVIDIQNDNTDADYSIGDTHFLTAAGFSAVVLVGIYSIPVAGEIIFINAIGIHD